MLVSSERDWYERDHPYLQRMGPGAWEREVARGVIPGHSNDACYGRVVIAGARPNPILIWPIDNTIDVNVPADPGVHLQVRSTSPNDTLLGTGIRQVRLTQLEGALDQVSETVNMNGTTPVPLTTPLTRFIQCMHGADFGDGRRAAGDIIAEPVGGGPTYSIIVTGARRCSSTARRVPRGKIYIVTHVWMGGYSISADAGFNVSFAATKFGGLDFSESGLLIPLVDAGAQNIPFGLNDFNFEASEGTIIALTVDCDKPMVATGGYAYREEVAPIELP